MTALLVVRNAGGFVVCSGPDDGNYQPVIPAGCTVSPEVDPVLNFPAPSKADRISQILETQGEGKDRTTLQLAIQLAELTATVQAPDYGMTPAQAIAYAYSKNATYKRSKDAESAIRTVELEP